MAGGIDLMMVNLENQLFNSLSRTLHTSSGESNNAEPVSFGNSVSFGDMLKGMLNSAVSTSDATSTADTSTGIMGLLNSGISGISGLFGTANTDNTQTVAGGMNVSDDLVNFIANHEGYSGTAYRGADSWNQTIGYGHVIEPGESFGTLSKSDALALLKNDLGSYENSVNKEFAGVKLTQNQFDALTSFCYNLGTNIWSKVPKLTSDIKSGASADTLMTDFVNCSHCGGKVLQGLVNRRIDECNMFTNGQYSLLA